jgi:3-dehydroquinate dehydratase / shikimate dehydrogenase
MPAALLCETVTGGSTADLVEARDASAADMVELRLDGLRSGFEVAGVLNGRRRPVIVTCRPRWEGGLFDGSEEDRKAVLRQALELGAEFVDVEWRAGFDDVIRLDPSRVVVSAHDFDGVPDDLSERVRAMRATGGGTIKVAVMVSRLSDTLPLLEIAREGPAVVIGMGDAGMVSRLLATRFGSRWTYAGRAVAPGQIPLDRMVDEFGFRRVGPDTGVYGVVSRNALHSLSPVMHNAAFAAGGVPAVYVPLCASDFADFERFSTVLGLDGASVTIPFKRDALAAARSADPMAVSVGAANTLRRRNGAWEATNTDVEGFLAPLEAELPALKGVRAAVLGAGGAARAVVLALGSRGARVEVHARRVEQASEVARDLAAASGPWPPSDGSWDLLVNCTPLGGPDRRDESPLPGGPFGGRFVYDLTYGPGESRLLREARVAGCRTLDGLPMLVAQAERQFEWWTGRPPVSGVMRAAAEQRVAGGGRPRVGAGASGPNRREPSCA